MALCVCESRYTRGTPGDGCSLKANAVECNGRHRNINDRPAFSNIAEPCPESRAEWMELGGGGGAVCYAPSRLGKLVLRVTGFPRVTQQCHVSQHPEENHHRETRHLYLGFHHPWDRDLWKGWIKERKSEKSKETFPSSSSPRIRD